MPVRNTECSQNEIRDVCLVRKTNADGGTVPRRRAYPEVVAKPDIVEYTTQPNTTRIVALQMEVTLVSISSK